MKNKRNFTPLSLDHLNTVTGGYHDAPEGPPATNDRVCRLPMWLYFGHHAVAPASQS